MQHSTNQPVRAQHHKSGTYEAAGKSAAAGLSKETQPVSSHFPRTEAVKSGQTPVVITGQHEKTHAPKRLATGKMQHSTNQPVRAQHHKSGTYEVHAQQSWTNTQSGNSILSQPLSMIAGTMHDTDGLDEAGNGQRQVPTQTNTLSFAAHSMDTASAVPLRASHTTGQKSTPSSGPWTVLTAMKKIGHAAAQKKFQLELRLEPAHLGKIHVYLDSDANKQIQVHLEIDQAASRQAIEQHLPVLRHALAQQGLNMGNFSMASGQDQGSFHRRQEHDLSADSAMASNKQLGASKNQAPAASSGRLSIHI